MRSSDLKEVLLASQLKIHWLCRQRLLPNMRQTQKGDTEFDMSVSVLSATGESCVDASICCQWGTSNKTAATCSQESYCGRTQALSCHLENRGRQASTFRYLLYCLKQFHDLLLTVTVGRMISSVVNVADSSSKLACTAVTKVQSLI